jgi:molybdopterin/thiamine biosynthesis adenylyltransferase
LKPALLTDLKSAAKSQTFPDGRAAKSLSVKDVVRLSRKYGIGGGRVELSALANDIIPDRYIRNMRTFSIKDQAALLQARVCIVGLGGLGGTVVEILARVGIGALTLIDGDTFEDSNLNRQFLATQSKIGTSKVQAAQERVAAINTSIVTDGYHQFLDKASVTALIRQADVIVDCLDNLKTRFFLEEAAKRQKTPLVSAAIGGTSGQVTAIFPQDRGLALIYGKPEELPDKGAEAQLGCLPQVVALVAALQCAQVVKICLGQTGGILQNKLLVTDIGDNTFDIMQLV